MTLINMKENKELTLISNNCNEICCEYWDKFCITFVWTFKQLISCSLRRSLNVVGDDCDGFDGGADIFNVKEIFS